MNKIVNSVRVDGWTTELGITANTAPGHLFRLFTS